MKKNNFELYDHTLESNSCKSTTTIRPSRSPLFNLFPILSSPSLPGSALLRLQEAPGLRLDIS